MMTSSGVKQVTVVGEAAGCIMAGRGGDNVTLQGKLLRKWANKANRATGL